MGNAVEIADGVLVLQADLGDTGPVAALQKSRHGAVYEVLSDTRGLIEEVAEGLADDVLERCAHQVGKTPIDGTNFTGKRDGHQNVVERVDQVPVALLRASDHIVE